MYALTVWGCPSHMKTLAPKFLQELGHNPPNSNKITDTTDTTEEWSYNDSHTFHPIYNVGSSPPQFKLHQDNTT